NILSKEGVMMMNHLMGGVKKGAFTAEQAAEKFEAWKADKSGRVAAVNNKLATEKAAKAKARLEAEIEANKAKAEAVAAKLAAAAAATEEVATEEATEETAAE
ncbi:MAG: 30S ribosomal protein S16, partial [Bacteroidales bacterium]